MPPRRSKRLAEASAADGDNPTGKYLQPASEVAVPIPPPRAQKRARIENLDGEDDLVDSSGPIASQHSKQEPENTFGGSVQASEDEDFEDDEVHLAYIDVCDDIEDDEDDAEDDYSLESIDDEGEEEEVDVSGDDMDEGELDQSTVNDRRELFRTRLQFIVLGFITAASGLSDEETDWLLTPMTSAFCRFLTTFLDRTSQLWLVEQILLAIPDRVKLVLGQQHWTLKALLSLPQFSEKEPCPGVYADVPTGPVGYEVYVGSGTRMPSRKDVGGLGARKRDHRWEINGKGASSGAHHSQCRRPGWHQNMRLLAKFPLGTAHVYSLFTESVMMVFLATFQHRGYYHRFAPASTYELADKLRPSSMFPSVTYEGLNNALSVRQALLRDRRPKACSNPACSATSETDPKTDWNNVDPSKPFGAAGYRCTGCHIWFKKYGTERTSAQTERGLSRKFAPRPEVCPVCNALMEYGSAYRNPARFDAVGKRFLCPRCFRWARDHNGGDRPGTLWDTNKVWPCSNCGTTRSQTWKLDRSGLLRCCICYRYFCRAKPKGTPTEMPSKSWKTQTGITYDPLSHFPASRRANQKDLFPPKEKLNLADQDKSPQDSDGLSPSGKLNPVEPASEEAGPSLSASASTRRSGRSKKPVDYRDSIEV